MKTILLIVIAVLLFIIAAVAVGEYLKPENAPNSPVVTAAKASIAQKTIVLPQMKQVKKDNTTLANPASVNCENQGGNLVIKKMGNGGEYGLCEFEDNQACEEWALYRGDCPVGGVKTTGFDNVEQSYCAWIGGQTLAVQNAQCTLPDGTVCSDHDLYNGLCPQN